MPPLKGSSPRRLRSRPPGIPPARIDLAVVSAESAAECMRSITKDRALKLRVDGDGVGALGPPAAASLAVKSTFAVHA